MVTVSHCKLIYPIYIIKGAFYNLKLVMDFKYDGRFILGTSERSDGDKTAMDKLAAVLPQKRTKTS